MFHPTPNSFSSESTKPSSLDQPSTGTWEITPLYMQQCQALSMALLFTSPFCLLLYFFPLQVEPNIRHLEQVQNLLIHLRDTK